MQNHTKGDPHFVLHGKTFHFNYANQVYIHVFVELYRQDQNFFEKFAALEEHGASRRYLGRSPEELFPTRPDFAKKPTHWREISPGWYLGYMKAKKTWKV